MVSIANSKDINNLAAVLEKLNAVLRDETKELVNFECETGTSRTEVPLGNGECAEHAVQKISISIVYMDQDGALE